MSKDVIEKLLYQTSVIEKADNEIKTICAENWKKFTNTRVDDYVLIPTANNDFLLSKVISVNVHWDISTAKVYSVYEVRKVLKNGGLHSLINKHDTRDTFRLGHADNWKNYGGSVDEWIAERFNKSTQ